MRRRERTLFLPSTSFPSNGNVCEDNSGLPDKGVHFVLPLGFRGHLGSTVWNLPTIPELCERNLDARTAQVPRSARAGGGRGRARPRGAVATATQPAFQNDVSAAGKTAPESFLFVIPRASAAGECTKGILYLERSDSLHGPEQRKTLVV